MTALQFAPDAVTLASLLAGEGCVPSALEDGGTSSMVGFLRDKLGAGLPRRPQNPPLRSLKVISPLQAYLTRGLGWLGRGQSRVKSPVLSLKHQ